MQVAGMIRARSLRRVAHALSCTIVSLAETTDDSVWYANDTKL